MDDARIGFINKVDASTTILAASPTITLAPIARIQDPHVNVKWQSVEPAAFFVIDLGTVQAIDCVRAMGLTANTIRIRYSTASATDGDVHDTGAVNVNQVFLTHTDIRSVSARYIRVDLTSDNVCECGRVFVGELNTFGFSFSPAWTRKWVDPSDRKKTEGGQTRVNRRPRYRAFSVAFELLSDAEANGFTDDIDRINGMTDDVLLITDPASDDLERDSIWGLMTDLNPIAQQFIDRWQKTISIEQRV